MKKIIKFWDVGVERLAVTNSNHLGSHLFLLVTQGYSLQRGMEGLPTTPRHPLPTHTRHGGRLSRARQQEWLRAIPCRKGIRKHLWQVSLDLFTQRPGTVTAVKQAHMWLLPLSSLSSHLITPTHTQVGYQKDRFAEHRINDTPQTSGRKSKWRRNHYLEALSFSAPWVCMILSSLGLYDSPWVCMILRYTRGAIKKSRRVVHPQGPWCDRSVLG